MHMFLKQFYLTKLKFLLAIKYFFKTMDKFLNTGNNGKESREINGIFEILYLVGLTLF